MFFPDLRMRRARKGPLLRDLLCEVTLDRAHLVYPIFVCEEGIEPQIPGLGDNKRHTLKELPAVIHECVSLGIRGVALFPMVHKHNRDEKGTYALNKDGLIPTAVKVIKDTTDQIGVITDVALDPYTSHGQDGLAENGHICNDATVDVLQEMSLVLAQSGADVVAPSDMMDGRVAAIRQTLEANNFTDTLILSYCAKFASNLYGPFRDAVGSRECLGIADKKTYQMSYDRRNECLTEADQDICEGADLLMVKPATLYQDVIAKLCEHQNLPVFAYHVSGEYAMLQSAAAAGYLEFIPALLETLISIRRAGAQAIFTYGAMDVAKHLND